MKFIKHLAIGSAIAASVHATAGHHLRADAAGAAPGGAVGAGALMVRSPG